MGMMRTALTIAGTDSCGGAGIQADIKTMTMNGVYAMSAVTALTAQNTTGVFGIQEVSPEFLTMQIEAVVTDIFPDAVKTGMVSSRELIRAIAESIKKFSLRNVVVDPVMVATSGARLISDEAVETLKKELLPLAALITPNILEAERLLEGSGLPGGDEGRGVRITSEPQMEEAAREIHRLFGCNVLVKGGHSVSDASDFLYGKDADGRIISRWFRGARIDNPNTHGTGCTLSSAIAANLAKGMGLEPAVERAKAYISGALAARLDLGAGSGPLMHNFILRQDNQEDNE